MKRESSSRLWPSGGRRLIPEQLAGLLRAHARLMRAVAARFDGESEAPIRKRTLDAAASVAELEETTKRLGREPSPPMDLLTRLRATDTAARDVRDDLRTLSTLEEDLDAGPICAILDRIADHLDARADALTSPGEETGADGDLDLGDLLEDLDDHLSSLDRRRRAELSGGVGTEAVTTLRRLLIQAAGARHAVRSLVTDARRLATVHGDE